MHLYAELEAVDHRILGYLVDLVASGSCVDLAKHATHLPCVFFLALW